MYRVLIGAGALLLATVAVPVSAQAWDGYSDGYSNNGYYNNGYGDRGYGYRGYYGGQDYDDIRRHVRACQRHERLHETLNAARGQEHGQSFNDYADDRDVHDTLREAHEEYHENHPGAHDCRYWYSRYYNWNHGYNGRPYDRSYSYSSGGY